MKLTIDQTLQKAIEAHKAGKLRDAESLYFEIIQAEPKHSDANHNLGVMAASMNKTGVALKLFKTALDANPNKKQFWLSYIFALINEKKFENARDVLEQGKKLGLNGDEVESFEKILKSNIPVHNPSQFELNTLLDLYQKGQYQHAQNLAVSLTQGYPHHFLVWKLLGAIYKQTGKFQDSVNANLKALEISPNDAETHGNLGITLRALGRLEDAEKSYQNALAIKPDSAETHYNLANTLRELGRLEDAVKSYKKAISFLPDSPETHLNLGGTLHMLGRLKEAEKSYIKAVEINSNLGEAHSNLGVIYSERGLNLLAKKYHELAIQLNPKSLPFLWERAMCELPVVFNNKLESKHSLKKFKIYLDRIKEIVDNYFDINHYEVVGKGQPYYIAYNNNNNKEVLKFYGEICKNIMNLWINNNKIKFNHYKTHKDKIKVGIISAHIRYHSIWNAFLKGIVTQLDKNKFEIYIYYIEGKHDDETLIAINNSYSFKTGSKRLLEWYSTIKNDNLDFAIFPEIGMNQLTTQLACLRIANIQCTSWGHPETSGIPTVDYFLSSKLTEDDDSDNNYSEKLIKLENLGCYFDPPSLKKEIIDFSIYGIKDDHISLLCLGVPNKFHPDNDWIYVELAKKIKKCQFIFIKDHKDAYLVLESRLRNIFSINNLNGDYLIVFLPNLSRNEFNSLMNSSKLLLDTLYFSHFNTSMQALGNGLPIVTKYGKFMRARATSGMLKMLGITELIAANDNDYIKIVVKLCTDVYFYNEVKNKIISNVEKLYKDRSSIIALEDFLIHKKKEIFE